MDPRHDEAGPTVTQGNIKRRFYPRMVTLPVRLNVEGVSSRRRNGASSRKGHVVNGHTKHQIKYARSTGGRSGIPTSYGTLNENMEPWNKKRKRIQSTTLIMTPMDYTVLLYVVQHLTSCLQSLWQ